MASGTIEKLIKYASFSGTTNEWGGLTVEGEGKFIPDNSYIIGVKLATPSGTLINVGFGGNLQGVLYFYTTRDHTPKTGVTVSGTIAYI